MPRKNKETYNQQERDEISGTYKEREPRTVMDKVQPAGHMCLISLSEWHTEFHEENKV